MSGITHIKLEHYDHAAILDEDEAWRVMSESDEFLSKVDEYAKDNEVDFRDAYETILSQHERAGIDSFDGWYLRTDGLVERDLANSGDTYNYSMVLRREVNC